MRRSRWVVAGLAGWAAVQLVIPLRHLAYPGDVRWTEEGYYGSFRVMLTEKAGWLRFEVATRRPARHGPCEPSAVLTDWQERQAVARADLTLAAAHLVAAEMAAEGHPDVEVRADSFVSFNGRRRQRMIDPSVDLAALVAACPGVGVRPPARSADNGLMPSRRITAIALVVPIVAAIGVAVATLTGDDEPAPTELTSDGPRFDSLEELVAASDVAVVGTVAGVADGRLLTAPDRPDAGLRTRLVELTVERTLAGEPPTPLVVEEPAELLDGTPVVVDGMAPLDVGDRAVWFLVAGGSDDQPYHAVVNGQGRYEIVGATLRPAGEDRLSPASWPSSARRGWRRPWPSWHPDSRAGSARSAQYVRGVVEADELAGFRRGDPDAVRAVYRAYGGLVFAVCLRTLGSRELADEATQQTFVKAWRSAAGFDPTRELGPWLATIARRTSIDIHRREVAPADDAPRRRAARRLVGRRAAGRRRAQLRGGRGAGGDRRAARRRAGDRPPPAPRGADPHRGRRAPRRAGGYGEVAVVPCSSSPRGPARAPAGGGGMRRTVPPRACVSRDRKMS